MTGRTVGFVTVPTRLIHQDDGGWLSATFIYDPAEPFTVRILFPDELLDDDPNVWTFARDLLADGMDRHTGMGDVAVWPLGGKLYIRVLNPDDGVAILCAEPRVVRRFLDATFAAVPLGEERVDVDAALAKLLDGAT